MKTVDAIRHFTNANRLAKALGIHRSAITKWGETVPLLRQYQLQQLTGGELRVDDPPPAADPVTEPAAERAA